MDHVQFDFAVDLRPDPTTFEEWLAFKKCDTDLAVHGRVVCALSSLTVDEKSVFTEYELDVSDVLYAKPGHRPRLPVVIIKPGGSLKLPEGLVATTYDQYSELHLGREYILFLRAPKSPTDAYYLNDRPQPGVLEIAGASIAVTKRGPEMPLSHWLQRTSLEEIARASVWTSDTPQACLNQTVKPH